MLFDPDLDSPRYKGVWVNNPFSATEPAEPAVLREIDPFRIVAGEATGLKRDRKIWEFGYTSPYAAPSPWRQTIIQMFHKFVDGGLCSGMAAVTARQFDLARQGKAPRMAQLPLAPLMIEALRAHLQILTDPVILACKPYCLSTPLEGYRRLRQALDTPGPYRLVTLLPAFGESFLEKLPASHSVTVLGYEWGADGGGRIFVADPNTAGDPSGVIKISANGHFEYDHGGLKYTSRDIADEGEYHQPNFRLALLPASLFFPPQPRPFFNLVIIGLG